MIPSLMGGKKLVISNSHPSQKEIGYRLIFEISLMKRARKKPPIDPTNIPNKCTIFLNLRELVPVFVIN